ncbi:MAG TPA: fused MFS/spermidine synthase [Candidatus Acidoferrales bacterium]|nr:fused MFS/spermidine synthase [Candidatus Acidoferrales bacterium]
MTPEPREPQSDEEQPNAPPGLKSAKRLASKLWYGLVIFSSAFLLFQVQPLIAKIILPWFGGVASVWLTCLLFFQCVLLLGYLYSHLLARNFLPRTQGRIHAVLLAASLLTLPILPKATWKPSGPGHPAWHILVLLGLSVGAPYFLLSATSPLLQAWYARARISAGAYRFYALSNAGSMLGLITYPLLFEPMLSSSHQAAGWSIAYVIVAILCGAIALRAPNEASRAMHFQSAEGPRPNWQIMFLWVALAACGSALLLAVTNHISQNIAAVPLLWVIPLSLYLLSFILCFERRAWYHRGLFLRLVGLALATMTFALTPSLAEFSLRFVILLYCAGLFVCCMFCHGELARLKPEPAHLTSFYVMLALGGALGAAFVALVAPQIFSGYYELHVAMGACAIMVLVVNHRDPESPFYQARWQPSWLVLVGLAAVLIGSLFVTARNQSAPARLIARNFYGELRVYDEVAPNVVVFQGSAGKLAAEDMSYRKLMNGTIDHGLQFLAPSKRREPTSYFGVNSGVGIALRAAQTQRPVLRVGVIGLGAGTLAAYSRAGDRYTFYEINPLVVKIADEQFTFLKDSPANTDVVLGDARLSLERQSPQGFDVLVVDAFSGDSIPVHLLTREAFELYFRHLKSDGILAIHISNKYLNLRPVVEAAANQLGKEAVLVHHEIERGEGIYPATWILVGSRNGFLGRAQVEQAGTTLNASRDDVLWTDDFSSIFSILR